jgi:hypothetical protein
MPIPDFIDNVLPVGVHDCTPDEVAERFGRFQRSDRRMTLTERLRRYLDEAQQSGIVEAVIINGSYTMALDEPDDIDLIAVLRGDFDWTQELKPYQSNAIDRKAIRRNYRFDGFAYLEGQVELANLIAVFATVPEKHSGLTSRTHKGMVRVTL